MAPESSPGAFAIISLFVASKGEASGDNKILPATVTVFITSSSSDILPGSSSVSLKGGAEV